MAKKPEGTNFDKLLEELNGAKKGGAGSEAAAPVQKKSGFVTLIGRPNVGKSTLMNHLIGQKIAITSDKPQTTRNRIQTVYTDERGQIIFLDTPGIHKAKNKLGEYMVNVAEHTLKEVDLILWLVEPSTFIGAGERHIAEQLQGVKTPVILVINKTDLAPYVRADLEVMRRDSELMRPGKPFVFTNCMTGEGIDELVALIRRMALFDLGNNKEKVSESLTGAVR